MWFFETSDRTRSLKIAAERIHREDAVKTVEKIPISDTRTRRRYTMVADDSKEQLHEKIREVQLIVYCRFPDYEKGSIVDH